MNFELSGHIDVRPLVEALPIIEPQYTGGSWRAKLRGSPHGMAETVVLRGPPSSRPRDVLDALHVVTEAVTDTVQEIDDALTALAKLLHADIARAMIVRLPSYAAVTAHIDTGKYADATERYHVPLVTNSRSVVVVEPELKVMETGDVWWIDKHKPHRAANYGETPRVHLIFDTWGRR